MQRPHRLEGLQDHQVERSLAIALPALILLSAAALAAEDIAGTYVGE
jgi:hypothetical protein